MPAKFANVIWWTVYFAVGMVLQLHFPGIDALIPGIMLSCQEGKFRQTLVLCLIAILIQEGTGSLAFGNTILWYGALIFFFAVGRLFFVTGSLFFVVLLGMALGVTHSALLYVTSSLQGFSVDTVRLAQQAMAQALLIPPLYAVTSLARKRFRNHEYGI
ncbi:MAG: hypothetical protein DELT_01218 [Desulfovibrio sp.]